MLEAELLDRQITSQRGSLQHIKRWWRGVRPDKGLIVPGLTGWETMEEKDLVRPICIFTVLEDSRSS